MTEIITISEFKKLDSGDTFLACLKVKIKVVEATKEGTTGGSKWKRQSITIEDKTGEMKFSLFNGHIDKLSLGKTYEICELGVDMFMGNNTPKVISKTTFKEVTQSSDEFLNTRKKEIESEQTNKVKSTLRKMVEEKYGDELDEVLELMDLIKERAVARHEIVPHDAQIGLVVKILRKVD